MNRLWIIVVPALALLASCAGQDQYGATPTTSDPARPTAPENSFPAAPAELVAPETVPVAPSGSPSLAPKGLPQNGILKVGTDIQPGEYAVHLTSSSGGYWARLSCLTGESECIIANEIVQGDGYLTIPPSDVAVKVNDIQLTLTASADQQKAVIPVPQSSGTDSQGSVDVSGVHCNSTNPAVATGRTAQSLVLICETGVGRLYYKGMRLSDGSSVEIDDPVRTETGFTVTNAGVRYSLSRDALVITQGSTQLASEPMLQYWSN